MNTPTPEQREYISKLFENYMSRNEENLQSRIKALGWKSGILQRIEELGFIEKADWKTSQIHYIRKVYLR